MINCFASVRAHFKQSGIAKFYPSFMRELDFYEDYFSTHALIPNCFGYNKCGQFYQAIIDWNGAGLFSLEWDVSGIIDELKERSFPIIKIPKSCKLLFSDDRNVEMSKVQAILKTSNTQREPILLVWVEFIQRLYIVDGNHRYMAFCHSEQETIDAIILPAGFHLKHMLSEESIMRYKVFHNIAIMLNISQHLGCGVSEPMDDRNSLYPVSGYKIRVDSFRHVLLVFYWWFLKWRLRTTGTQEFEE